MNHRSDYRWRVPFLGCALVFTAFPSMSQAQDNARAAETFNERIQPIIMKSCNGCHTYGGHAGGLRMDSYASFMKGGDRGPIVVAGNPKASLIMKVIMREDPSLVMPPARPLPGSDVAIIESWITDPAAGALTAPMISASPEKPAAVAASAPAPKKSTGPQLAEPLANAAPKAADRPKITPAQEQFFEAKVRPLLAKNCSTCHTAAMNGGLRLDSREAILKGGAHGPAAVPGNPDGSLLITAVRYKSKPQMPPGGALKPEDVATLEQWVREGLPWPAVVVSSATSKVTEAQRSFWSFKPPVKPAVPNTDTKWAFNDLDRFIAARLAEKKLKPVSDADKRTLMRRVSYDLTGLPPSPEAMQAYLNDKSSKAYENLVEKLLASKAYGERWGRMWLDVVRYGDTSGGDGDFPIPQAAKYRDYVIKAFQDDKPYDRFIREQIAGDLLPAKSEPEHWENVVATGYLASAVREDGRYAYIADNVDNVGSAFMGLTVGCARCHDHKFDPLPTADYYSLYGILMSTEYPEPGAGNARYQRGFTYRDPKATEREDYKTFQAQFKPIADAILAVRKLPGTYDDLVPQLEARRMHLFEHMPDIGESAYAVREGEKQNAKIQHYGDPKDLGPEVPRGFLQVLGGGPLPADTKGSGRMELADWLVSKDHALTARVMVNRIWQGHFGRGIVATPNDFGTRGTPPSNQELLDYLAVKFVEGGWSVKAIHREILMSHAYRLSSTDNPENSLADPDNSYIWRHSRVRMDAEQIRDTLLMQSGLLDNSPAGEHPFPPPHIWNWEDQNQFAPDLKEYENDRRTVYTMVPRSTRLQYFNLFDGPNTNVSTDHRSSSLTPLQALYFMNGPFPKRAATSMVSRLMETRGSEKDNLEKAFLTVYGRPATQAEIDRSINFLHNAADLNATKGTKQGTPQQNAWTELIQAMFASNEFMFIE